MTVLVVALGVATALAYGACDFFGGLAARRTGTPLVVVALFHLVALILFAAAMPVAGGTPTPAAATWGALAGIAGGVAYLCYFHALAVGRMGVVATVTAVWAAVVPLLVGLLLGERPTPLVWAGIAAVLVAIVLVTYGTAGPEPDPEPALPPAGSAPLQVAHPPRTTATRRRTRLSAGVLPATAGGAAFGMFFVALDRAGAATAGSLAWPLLAAAVTAAVVVTAAAVAVARPADWQAARRLAPAVVLAGALHAVGTWAFILGVSYGWVSVVAVVAALSPAPTMLLARIFLGESLTARQLWGTPLALLGIVLITAGLPS